MKLSAESIALVLAAVATTGCDKSEAPKPEPAAAASGKTTAAAKVDSKEVPAAADSAGAKKGKDGKCGANGSCAPGKCG